MDHDAAGKGLRHAAVHQSFHTLRTKLGIKDTEQHLILKYRGCLHKYIKKETKFLNISSLGTAYRYAVKVKQKFK